MIIDTLSDAATQIRDYLTSDATHKYYTDPDALRLILEALEAMDHARIYLEYLASERHRASPT